MTTDATPLVVDIVRISADGLLASPAHSGQPLGELVCEPGRIKLTACYQTADELERNIEASVLIQPGAGHQVHRGECERFAVDSVEWDVVECWVTTTVGALAVRIVATAGSEPGEWNFAAGRAT